MARVYLETSLISACVSTRDDAASVYRRDVSVEWWTLERIRHELFVSEEVHVELSHPAYRSRAEALSLIGEVPLLPVSQDVRGLATILVDAFAMPGPAEKGDALHVAVATVFGCEYMLSWNVEHLANVNKARHLRAICRRVGYVPPEIVTPDVFRGE